MATNVVDPILAAQLSKGPTVPLAAYDDTTSVILDLRGLKEKALLVKNGGAGALTYNILGSLDDGAAYDITVRADTAVAAANQDLYRDSNYCTHWKVQLKGATASATVKFAAIGV